MKIEKAFDLSKPGVAVRASDFGGGWAWALDAAGGQALFEFFREAPAECPPIGRVAYIVEPYQSADLAEHLRACNVAWEID